MPGCPLCPPAPNTRLWGEMEGWGLGGRSPPSPVGLMEKIKKQKSGRWGGEKSRVSAAMLALPWAPMGGQGVSSGLPNTQ